MRNLEIDELLAVMRQDRTVIHTCLGLSKETSMKLVKQAKNRPTTHKKWNGLKNFLTRRKKPIFP